MLPLVQTRLLFSFERTLQGHLSGHATADEASELRIERYFSADAQRVEVLFMVVACADHLINDRS